MKRFLFSLDGTLCTTVNNDFKTAEPIKCHIDYVNYLKDQGHYIIIWTDREDITGVCHTNLTYNQLCKWNVKYDKILLSKPVYDVLYDNRAFDQSAIDDHFYESQEESTDL